MNFQTFCSQPWHSGASSKAGVFCGSFWLLSSWSNYSWRGHLQGIQMTNLVANCIIQGLGCQHYKCEEGFKIDVTVKDLCMPNECVQKWFASCERSIHSQYFAVQTVAFWDLNQTPNWKEFSFPQNKSWVECVAIVNCKKNVVYVCIFVLILWVSNHCSQLSNGIT